MNTSTTNKLQVLISKNMNNKYLTTVRKGNGTGDIRKTPFELVKSSPPSWCASGAERFVLTMRLQTRYKMWYAEMGISNCYLERTIQSEDKETENIIQNVYVAM